VPKVYKKLPIPKVSYTSQFKPNDTLDERFCPTFIFAFIKNLFDPDI
jgi:hypothetical protein